MSGPPAGLAEQHRIFVLGDCAESPGAEVQGRETGSPAGAGFFSFETVKPINTFGGGMIVTNNEALAKEAMRVVSSLPAPPIDKLTMKIAGSYFESLICHPAELSGIDGIGY